MRSAMENYIVRIYRRENDNPRMLVGLIEEVGSKGKKAFTSYDELWEILNCDKCGTKDGKSDRREK